MSSNINTVLAECEKQAQQLISEIKNYRTAGQISEQTAKSLASLGVALTETQKRIKPFTEVFSRRALYFLGAALFLNLVLSAAVLIVLVFKN